MSESESESGKLRLLQDLRLPQDLAEEDRTQAISKLISLAAGDESHPVSLRDIHCTISRHGLAEYLEPLDVLPTLLPCRHDGALDLILLCAANSSAKEVMIVVQEEIEHLQTCLNNDDDDEDSGHHLAQRAIGIVTLCSPAISRLKLGKRSAIELCSPVLANVISLISSVSSLATDEQGRTLITGVATMVKHLAGWASEVSDASGIQAIKRLLRELLDTTVVSYASSIQMSLAVRAAGIHFPRFFPHSLQEKEGQRHDGVMSIVELALESLGDSPRTTPWKPHSLCDLIYLAHSTAPLPVSPSSLPDLHRLLIHALQMNQIIDEALSLLFGVVANKSTSISADVLTSLTTVFTVLASTHLDSTTRQLNLLLLSLTLARLPSAPRLEILLRLTTHEEFPQIRGPAIGFVKEAVLEALALPASQSSRNPFGSPELLRVFGGVLFKPNPPEFFDQKKTREELAQSLELLRIADCLSFYYVLLQRDRDNKTGVRSKSNVASVQNSILRPLRQFLDQHLTGEEQPLMAILALQVGLDRINGALKTLNLGMDG